MNSEQPSFSFYHLPSALYYLLSSFFCLYVFLTFKGGADFLVWLMAPIGLAIAVSLFLLTIISIIKMSAFMPINASRVIALAFALVILLFVWSAYLKFTPILDIDPALIAGLFFLSVLAEIAASYPFRVPYSDINKHLTIWQENVGARLVQPIFNFIIAFLSAGITLISFFRVKKQTMESNSSFGLIFALVLFILVFYTPLAGLIFAIGYAKLS